MQAQRLNNDEKNQPDKAMAKPPLKLTHSSDTVLKLGLKDGRLLRRYSTSRICHFEKVMLGVSEKLKDMESIVNINRQSIERCVCIIAQCQQQMTKLIGRDIERFALNPAILAVVALADEIVRLSDMTAEDGCKNGLPNSFEVIRQQIQQSANIAKDKLKHLGIEKIRPIQKEMVDPAKHDVRTCTPTDDKNLHGRISSVLSDGIIYRGNILKQAKVSVYRYSDTTK
jgi:molecular chaperone GrpE (heat shock protein)